MLAARENPPEVGEPGNDSGASDVPGGSGSCSPKLCNMSEHRHVRRWSIVGAQAGMWELQRAAIRSASPVRRGQHYMWQAASLGSVDSLDQSCAKMCSNMDYDPLSSDQFDCHEAAAASDDHDCGFQSSRRLSSSALPGPFYLARLASVEATTTSCTDQSESHANTPPSAETQSTQGNRNSESSPYSQELFLGRNYSRSMDSRSDGMSMSATPKFIAVTCPGPAPQLARGLSDNSGVMAYKAGDGSSGLAETKMRESSRGLEVGAPVIPPSPKLQHVRRAPPLPRTSWEWPLRNEVEFERGVGELEGFGFDTLSFGSDDLCHLIQELFRKLDLPSQLRIPEQKIQKFILAVRDGMPANDYHSFHHVADVTQTLYALAKRTNLLEALTPLDQFALLLAGLAHDLEHPGMTIDVANRTGQKQESNWRSNTSLEKHHSIRAFELMVDNQVGLLDNLDTNEYYRFRQSVVDIILATDMQRHGEYVTLVESCISSRDGAIGQNGSDTMDSLGDTASRCSSFEILSCETSELAHIPTSLNGSCGQCGGTLELASASNAAVNPASTGISRVSSTSSDQSVVVMVWGEIPKKKAMELLMKMADTSNVFKKFDVAKKWNLRVTNEFFHQGDVERRSGLPVTPMCDRELQTRIGLQLGFMRFIRPFHSNVAQIAGNLGDLIDELDTNLMLFEGYNDERLLAELAQS